MPGTEADHWGSTGGAHIGAGAALVGHILGLVQQSSWRVTTHYSPTSPQLYSVKYIYIHVYMEETITESNDNILFFDTTITERLCFITTVNVPATVYVYTIQYTVRAL